MLKPALRVIQVAGAIVVAVLAFASCGSDDDEKDSSPLVPGTTVVPEVSQVPRLGGDPKATKAPEGAQTLGALPRARRADKTTVVPRIADVEGLGLPQALDSLSNDIGSFWQGAFNEAGLEFVPAEHAIITPGGPPVTTRCADGDGAQDVPSDFPTAFYCAPDDRLFLPVDWFEDVVAPSGDVAVATVVAHEWGHRVQDLVAVAPDTDPQWRRGPGYELMADCLAGVWMASVYERGTVREGDVRKGLDVFKKGSKPPKGIPEGALAHGTSQDRMDAFALGYDSADPARCQDITPEGL
jgi:predicted metalloprotease